MHSRVSQQDSLRYKLSGFGRDEIDRTSNRDWSDCTRCGLHRTRTRVALKRRGGTGRIRLLLIGEAPGEFEDTLGVPFIGPAGNVLNHLIDYVPHQFQYLITNIVSCRPCSIVFLSQEAENDHDFNDLVPDEDYEVYDHNREPSNEEIASCAPHVTELIEDYKPHGVVYLGKVARKFPTHLPACELLHPAYIVRLERKLQTVLDQSQKLSRFVERLAANHP